MTPAEYIARQLRKPSGWFGKQVTARLLNRLNEPINTKTLDLLAVQPADRVLEVGFGGGDLIGRIAEHAVDGFVAGVDFSPEMVERCAGRYRALVEVGRMAFRCANAEALPYPDGHFDKICTVNTLYFWPRPEKTVKKVADLLIPGGKLIIAFEDIKQLQQRKLSEDIFQLYAQEDVENLLRNAGFSGDVRIESRTKGKLIFHCAVAIK